MDKQSKILFAVFTFIVIGSLLSSYNRYLVNHEYIVDTQVSCDPMTESCFVSLCDPEVDETCTGDPAEDTTYYKLLHRNAKYISLCDPNKTVCETLICPPGEPECVVTLCNPDISEVECSDPETYMEMQQSQAEDDASEDTEIGADEAMIESPTETENTDNATPSLES